MHEVEAIAWKIIDEKYVVVACNLYSSEVDC